jgi:hypothetical protein
MTLIGSRADAHENVLLGEAKCSEPCGVLRVADLCAAVRAGAPQDPSQVTHVHMTGHAMWLAVDQGDGHRLVRAVKTMRRKLATLIEQLGRQGRICRRIGAGICELR